MILIYIAYFHATGKKRKKQNNTRFAVVPNIRTTCVRYFRTFWLAIMSFFSSLNCMKCVFVREGTGEWARKGTRKMWTLGVNCGDDGRRPVRFPPRPLTVYYAVGNVLTFERQIVCRVWCLAVFLYSYTIYYWVKIPVSI